MTGTGPIFTFPLALLRNLIAVDPTDPQADLLESLRMVRREIAPPSSAIYADLLQFLSSVAERTGQVPTLQTVRAHYQRREQEGAPEGPAALQVLLDLETARIPRRDLAAFRVELDAYKAGVLTDHVRAMLLEAATILQTGTTTRQRVNGSWQTVTLRGVEPALDRIHTRLRDLDVVLRRRALEGEVQTDVDQVVWRYDRIARDPSAQYGILSGLSTIDTVHRGIRRGELALVLGFVGHLKTTFCLNWLYKAAVFQGKHVAMASLETPVDVLMDLLVCLHAMHPRFSYDRRQHLLTYDRLRAGQLTPAERQILAEVAEDLKTNPTYGRIAYKQPAANLTVADIRSWCERLHLDRPLDLLVIDYLGLVDPEKGESGLQQFASLNRAIRAAKLLAVEFADGAGLAVLSPFQANREGLKEAQANGGRYTLRALSGANEAERSADLVYYVYLDDGLRRVRELAVGNLKSRNVPLIVDQWRVFADPATRVIDDLDVTSVGLAGVL